MHKNSLPKNALVPVLFNTDMVRAILDGRKTVTRRIIKPQPSERLCFIWGGKNAGKWKYSQETAEKWRGEEYPLKTDPLAEMELARTWNPPYHADDILWVRETWCNLPVSPGGHTRLMRGMYYYKADVPDIRPERWRGNWSPSIHMPKEAARIFLRVKCIRVDKLQDSFNDIVTVAENFKAEGIDLGEHCENCIDDYGNPKCSAYIDDDGMMTGECHMLDDIRTAFSDLWDETVKPTDRQRYGWAANPWVWVIEFERIEKPEEWA